MTRETPPFSFRAPMLRGFNWLVSTDPEREIAIEATRPDQLWWDIWGYGDIPSRQVEAFLLLREATGITGGEEQEAARRRHIFAHVAEDGLLYRPGTRKTAHGSDMFSQGRYFRALVCLLAREPESSEVRQRIAQLIHGLRTIATSEGDARFFPAHHWLGTGWSKLDFFGNREFQGDVGETGVGDQTAQCLAPLVEFHELTGDPGALALAQELARGFLLPRRRMLGADGSFANRQTHSVLANLIGLLRVGLVANRAEWVELARQSFHWVQREVATSFGFVPEYARRGHECETCALVDYLELALRLALAGDAAMWEVAERVARNHLVESQCPDGGFAGYSMPNELGARQSLEPMIKIFGTLASPCCAAHGLRGFYLVWKHALSVEQNSVRVNLLVDAERDGVRVRSHLPDDGKLEITLSRQADLAVRLPSWVAAVEVTASRPGLIRDGYWRATAVPAHQPVTIQFPVREESETVHQPFEKGPQEFQVRWRGDTVVGISPEGNQFPVFGRTFPLYVRSTDFSRNPRGERSPEPTKPYLCN